jgi:hypothetical protein
MPNWTHKIIDAARPVLTADRALAIVLMSTTGEIRLHDKVFALSRRTPTEPTRKLLQPYILTADRLAAGGNAYVVVRFLDRIVVYIGAETVLAQAVA